MLRKIFRLAVMAAMSVFATAQQSAPPPQQVNVHVLNICTPSQEEQKKIAAALRQVPKQPIFTPDFEVARGRSTQDHDPIRTGRNTSMSLEPATVSWVRMRRDFSAPTVFSNVEYSFGASSGDMMGTLVLRDPTDLVQLSVADCAVAMLGSAIAVTRIRLERFGKRSVVLAEGMAWESNPPPHQSAYEPLFRDGSSLMDRHRTLLHARQTVPEELANVGPRSSPTFNRLPEGTGQP